MTRINRSVAHQSLMANGNPVAACVAEMQAQDDWWGKPEDAANSAAEWTLILGREFGELQTEMGHVIWDGMSRRAEALQAVRWEAIQVAAVALQIAHWADHKAGKKPNRSTPELPTKAPSLSDQVAAVRDQIESYGWSVMITAGITQTMVRCTKRPQRPSPGEPFEIIGQVVVTKPTTLEAMTAALAFVEQWEQPRS